MVGTGAAGYAIAGAIKEWLDEATGQLAASWAVASRSYSQIGHDA